MDFPALRGTRRRAEGEAFMNVEKTIDTPIGPMVLVASDDALVAALSNTRLTLPNKSHR